MDVYSSQPCLNPWCLVRQKTQELSQPGGEFSESPLQQQPADGKDLPQIMVFHYMSYLQDSKLDFGISQGKICKTWHRDIATIFQRPSIEGRAVEWKMRKAI